MFNTIVLMQCIAPQNIQFVFRQKLSFLKLVAIRNIS